MSKVLFITALPLEYKAVRYFLTNCEETENEQGNVYETANYQNWEVGLAEIGQGNPNAAMETERAIQFFKPNYVFFVGVAGGIKDVNLGDVVIAEVAKGYEKGKETDLGFLARGDIGQSDYALIQRAKANARNEQWFEKLNTNLNPKALIGVIAAGEKVVASEHCVTYERLTKLYSDALAVEMEGIGFLKAIHANDAKGIVIRGISDLLSNKTDSDNSGWQETAAHHAAAFALGILDKLAPITKVNNSDEFSDSWFKSHIETSISDLGHRYTPEINFELDIAKNFDALSRNNKFLEYFRDEIHNFLIDFKKIDNEFLEKDITRSFIELLNNWVNISRDQNLLSIDINSIKETIKIIRNNLYKYEKHLESKRNELTKDSFNHKTHNINMAHRALYSFESFINSPALILTNKPVMLLLGEAGIGKSHLLGDIARKRLSENKSCILLLGQKFTSEESPWTRILNNLLRVKCMNMSY